MMSLELGVQVATRPHEAGADGGNYDPVRRFHSQAVGIPHQGELAR